MAGTPTRPPHAPPVPAASAALHPSDAPYPSRAPDLGLSATLSTSVCSVIAEICLLRESELDDWGARAGEIVFDFCRAVIPTWERSARWVSVEVWWRHADGQGSERGSYRAGRGGGGAGGIHGADHAWATDPDPLEPEDPRSREPSRLGLRIGVAKAGERPAAELEAALGQISRAAGRAVEVLVLAPLRRRRMLLDRLSDAQQKTLPYLIERLSERQIAELMDRSVHTVHDHARAIYIAWGVDSRRELIAVWEGKREPGLSPQGRATELIVRPLETAPPTVKAVGGTARKGHQGR